MCRTSLLNPPVKFTFDEPYSNQPDYKPKEHKESGVYETVFVLEDSPNKIVLQHILQAGGHVVKHWRQDWTYQPQAMWSYAGDYAWQSVALTPAQSQGKWLQTVWQVDDSPRYAGLGEWKNNHGIIEWTSDASYRPLPRRESTTRDDYDVMVGVNRHALTNTGWVHEQDNVKYNTKTQQAIVRERGVNYYELVKGHDFSKSYAYWKNNANYWKSVVKAWDKAFAQNKVLALPYTNQDDADKSAHYLKFFEQAKSVEGKKLTEKQLDQKAETLLNQVLTQGKVQ